MKKLLRLISVATMLLAATTFMACSSDDDDGPSESSSATRVGSGAFVGVVLDNTGKPVEGATVTLGNKTASTNKGGEFKLEGVAVNDPVVKSVQTTVSNNALVPATATAPTGANNAALNYAYTLTVTKDGYIPGTVTSMYVSEAEDIGGIEDARLSSLKDQYATILNAYAGAVGASTVATNSNGDIYGITGSTLEDKSATMKTVAEALKEIQKLYANLGKTYSSTFVECKTLVPLNASLSGKLKLNPSPATAEVYNETTYPAPKDTVVTVAYTHDKNSAPYTFKTKTDAEGNFKFEKLPSGVTLSIEVEGFTAKAGEVEAYFSTDGGLKAYRANFEEILNNGEYYSDGDNATKNSITIDGNSLNVSGVDIMLFAQLEKIWVKETNLIKNNSAALISVKTPLEFTFNKAIQRVALDGSGFQDVKDENYVVTIDSTDAKKVTITPKDGIWNPVDAGNGTNDAKAGEVRLSVLAADGTKELVNSKFTACFDTTIYIAITESSKKDKLLSLTAPVVLTFSKPMRTAAVVAKDGSTELTSDYTKDWTENNTVLTLTPKKYWDPVTSADAEVTFTVTGVAEDETTTVKYWKTNSGNGGNATGAFTGLKVYFDNVIDVTLAKVNDAKFTATFSKALKEIPALDLSSYFTIKYYAPGSNTAAVVNDAKLSFADKVLTVEAKTGEFEHYGYYEVTVATTVVGATGESKFRETGKTATATAFKADFTLGAEFKETTVEVVTTLPETAVASRAIYADAASYVKITFTKDIGKSNLKVTGQTVTNYIDGKSVYLPLAKNADEEEVKITGTVTAKIGDTKEWGTTGTPAVLTPGLKVSKNIFKMVESSLYKQVVSIAEGKNDATVTEIKPTDSITFTFDQDVTGADWTAELYDSANVIKKDLNKTVYKVDVTKEGKVVTVKLAEGSKALVNGDTYYLSLKAVKGNEKIVVYDSSTFKATATDPEPADKYYAYIPGTTTTLGSKFIAEPATNFGKTYIKIDVESETAKYKDLYVVEAGKKNSKTTAFKDFAKGIKNPIVLEFAGVDNITGFTAVLATSDKSSAWDKAEKVELKDTYASEAKIEGNVLTITPTVAYPHGKTIYPMVFNAEGGLVQLKDIKGADLINASGDNKYVSNDLSDTKILDAATATTDSSALKLTQIDTTDTANGQSIVFSFDKQLSAYEATYGKYTLYKKVVPAVESAAKWVEAATYAVSDDPSWVASGTGATTAINLVDGNKAGGTAKFNDFRILKKNAALVTSAGTDFTYSGTILYRLVFENANLAIWSDVIAVNENAIIFGGTGKEGLTMPAQTDVASRLLPSGTTEDKVITITTTNYIKTVSVTVTRGASTAGEEDNRISKSGKLTYEADGKDVKIKINKDAEACKGDYYKVTVTDTNGQTTSKTITFE